MRVVVAHNFYTQPGGEDSVFASEMELLKANGHEVWPFTMSNDDIALMGHLAVARKTLWNGDAKHRLRELLRKVQPDIVHFHNTFPLMSPSVYAAARAHGAAVIQTLHNYRFLCPAGTFFREGSPCEDCLGKVPWRAVTRTCYRGRGASAVAATMLATHRALGTYHRSIDAYIALSRFARQRFVEGGLPADKVHVKSNFVDPDPGPGAGDGGYALFVGRLSEEKGIAPMLAAWQELNGTCPLKIVGDGPMREQVEKAAKSIPGIDYLGRKSLEEVCDLLGNAKALIFPSLWYEGMPRVIVESFAKGTPVVASNLGTMAEMIHHGQDGWLFPPGDAPALAAVMRKITMLGVLSPQRNAARREFERHYTAAENYAQLLQIYRKVIGRPRVSDQSEPALAAD